MTSVGVSPDGLCVAVGTESGALGMLDIPTHRYTPLLRSHVAAINAVAADPNRCPKWGGRECVTTSGGNGASQTCLYKFPIMKLHKHHAGQHSKS